MIKLGNVEKFMLKKVSDIENIPHGAFNIRENVLVEIQQKI